MEGKAAVGSLNLQRGYDEEEGVRLVVCERKSEHNCMQKLGIAVDMYMLD
jgi:hypothetical protein